MDRHVRDYLIEDWDALILVVALSNPDDPHVPAAAIKGGADVIVTFNRRDFPESAVEKYGIEIQDPDKFITHLLDPNEGLSAKRSRVNVQP
jgi:hypothetical protein